MTVLGHTQSHQNQCPFRQGHGDGAWWTRQEIVSDNLIYFVSTPKIVWKQCSAANKRQQCSPNPALTQHHKTLPGNHLLVNHSRRREKHTAALSFTKNNNREFTEVSGTVKIEERRSFLNRGRGLFKLYFKQAVHKAAFSWHPIKEAACGFHAEGLWAQGEEE